LHLPQLRDHGTTRERRTMSANQVPQVRGHNAPSIKDGVISAADACVDPTYELNPGKVGTVQASYVIALEEEEGIPSPLASL